MALSEAELKSAWEKALGRWGLAIQVDTPTFDPNCGALAFIDLHTRRVTVNPKQLSQLGAEDCIEAVFAHELGHHLRYPHSLSVQARLELLERDLLGEHPTSLLNLFTDLLINLELGEDAALREQIVRIYTGGPDKAVLEDDPPFFFFLTCFEEAWALPPHTLTRSVGPQLEKAFAGARGEAQEVAQELPNLAPNIFTQFIYFASVLSRYRMLKPGEKNQKPSSNPHHGDHSRPSPEDYADALQRSGQEQEALKKAVERGWITKEQAAGAGSTEGLTAGMPGLLSGDPKGLAETMAIHYRRLAEKHLVKPPAEKRSGDPIIPSTLSAWEIGDGPKEIDWLASISAGGLELGVAMPLKRDWIDDEPPEGVNDVRIRVEIYLDVSGSMPDPKATLNPMTLAAQVLCMSAIRHGGQARGLIYSSNFVEHWEWTRSEMVMSRFLMNYIGGGTEFPFKRLYESVRECGLVQPVRVVLTDADFWSNLTSNPKHQEIASGAARVSPFVAMLHGGDPGNPWVKTIAKTGIRCVPVMDLKTFPKVAAALGDALFGKNAAPQRRRRAAR